MAEQRDARGRNVIPGEQNMSAGLVAISKGDQIYGQLGESHDAMIFWPDLRTRLLVVTYQHLIRT
jgi:hypothetical protein